jgi:hypothetical protein
MDLLLLFLLFLLMSQPRLRAGIVPGRLSNLSSDRRASTSKPFPLEFEASPTAQPHREPAP